MSFLLRSALCITAVVLALPGGPPPSRDALVRSGLATARAVCRADAARCSTVLESGAAALLPVGPSALRPATRRATTAEGGPKRA